MRILRLITTFATAALLVLTGTSVAAATATDDEPGAVLQLAWSAGGSNQVFTATLTCSPNTGLDNSYADPDLVCADIAQANGDFNALPGWAFVDCTGYQGWTIRTRATGNWFGTAVNYDVTHANICEARRATGWVFDW